MNTNELGLRELTGLAVVTGGSSGIGLAVARALAEAGMRILLCGRDEERLRDACQSLPQLGAPHLGLSADLSASDEWKRVIDAVVGLGEGVSVLVSCAGALELHAVQETSTESLDRMLNVNLRAPFILVRELLPELLRSKGQIVFVNSSVVENPRAEVAAYAASKAGLRAFANCLRAEVNSSGVRVLSVYPGRTATPMQVEVYEREGREYRPERMLQPTDVARAILAALTLPMTAELTDLHLRPNIKG